MEGNGLVLKDTDRTKLDDIVSQMQTNKESDENIKFVVDDFKSKYGTTTSPESDAKKKGWCPIGITVKWYGRRIGIRNPFYFK